MEEGRTSWCYIPSCHYASLCITLLHAVLQQTTCLHVDISGHLCFFLLYTCGGGVCVTIAKQ